MQSDAPAVVPEDRAATLEELVAAVIAARATEDQMAKALQEARLFMGERQRAWQTAGETTRRALHELKGYIDRAAGVGEQHPGEVW